MGRRTALPTARVVRLSSAVPLRLRRDVELSWLEPAVSRRGAALRYVVVVLRLGDVRSSVVRGARGTVRMPLCGSEL
jgi:hypothetical protein